MHLCLCTFGFPTGMFPSFVWLLFVEYLEHAGQAPCEVRQICGLWGLPLSCRGCCDPRWATLPSVLSVRGAYPCWAHTGQWLTVGSTVWGREAVLTLGFCLQKACVPLHAQLLCKGEVLRLNGKSDGEKSQLCQGPAEPSLLGYSSIIHHLTVAIKPAGEPINSAHSTHTIMRNNTVVVVLSARCESGFLRCNR